MICTFVGCALGVLYHSLPNLRRRWGGCTPTCPDNGWRGGWIPWVFPRKSPDNSRGDPACHGILRKHALGMRICACVFGSCGQGLARCSKWKSAEDEFVLCPCLAGGQLWPNHPRTRTRKNSCLQSLGVGLAEAATESSFGENHSALEPFADRSAMGLRCV